MRCQNCLKRVELYRRNYQWNRKCYCASVLYFYDYISIYDDIFANTVTLRRGKQWHFHYVCVNASKERLKAPWKWWVEEILQA